MMDSSCCRVVSRLPSSESLICEFLIIPSIPIIIDTFLVSFFFIRDVRKEGWMDGWIEGGVDSFPNPSVILFSSSSSSCLFLMCSEGRQKGWKEGEKFDLLISGRVEQIRRRENRRKTVVFPGTEKQQTRHRKEGAETPSNRCLLLPSLPNQTMRKKM